jgi:hypothetical protein
MNLHIYIIYTNRGLDMLNVHMSDVSSFLCMPV